jgi:hypothetical protein
MCQERRQVIYPVARYMYYHPGTRCFLSSKGIIMLVFFQMFFGQLDSSALNVRLFHVLYIGPRRRFAKVA